MPLIRTQFDFHGTATEVGRRPRPDRPPRDRHRRVVRARRGDRRALAAAGAEVTLAVRDIEAGERAAKDVNATTGSTALRGERPDLVALGSVAEFAKS